MLSLINTACMFISTAAYVLCAIHIHYDGTHHDLCPFYAALAVGASVHFAAEVAAITCTWWARDAKGGGGKK